MLDPALAGVGAAAGALRAGLLGAALVAGTTGATAAFLAGDLRVALAGAGTGAGAGGTGMGAAAALGARAFLTAAAMVDLEADGALVGVAALRAGDLRAVALRPGADGMAMAPEGAAPARALSRATRSRMVPRLRPCCSRARTWASSSASSSARRGRIWPTVSES